MLKCVYVFVCVKLCEVIKIQRQKTKETVKVSHSYCHHCLKLYAFTCCHAKGIDYPLHSDKTRGSFFVPQKL